MLEDRWVEAGGVRTRYVETGSGPSTIAFLHANALADQGVCHNLRVWEANLEEIGSRARVVAFDALGQGRTGVPSEQSYGFDRVIEHARAFLDVAVGGPVHLVGHDEGGLAALRLAFEAPELIRSVTIVAGKAVAPAGDPLSNLTLSAPLEPRYGRTAQAWVMERQSWNGHHIDAGRFLDEAVLVGQSHQFKALHERLHGKNEYDTSVRPTLSRMRVDNWTRFREQGVPCPVMLVWGQNDPMSPVQNAMALFRLIAPRQGTAHLRIIGRAGYMPFREQPSVFNGIVAGFVGALDEVRGAGSVH